LFAVAGLATVVVSAVAAVRLVPLPDAFWREPSAVVAFEDGAPMRFYLTADDKWRAGAELSELDPLLQKATVCYEDRHFERHPGVNPFSMIRAAWQAVRSGRVVSGGSTITMQLARVLEPRPRNIASKIVQVFRALQLEARMGKREILKRYLSEAPYGGNFEGVTAASWAYFGKAPSKLDAAEAAYLVSLPQSPTRRSPGSASRAAARAGRDRVLDRMAACGLIAGPALLAAKSEPLPSSARPLPFHAPHAAEFLKSQIPNPKSQIRDKIISTLDRKLQERVERIAKSYRAQLNRLGARNVSVVVIENDTRKVRALVGNFDFFDSEAGQVAGFSAPRSPGSALKPFLYALALEKGVITPESLIEDAPVQIGSFRPLDFGETWEGLVAAERALSQSLNVPFVHILQRTGLDAFMRLLRGGGVDYAREMDYGLSVITGAIEVNLLDLTNLYVTLARGGMHGSYQLSAISLQPKSQIPNPKSQIAEETRLLNAAAVHLTRRALSIRNRPDAPLVGEMGAQMGKVYWKTGTSWGFRDAWSIGFNGQYTVGVWAGKFSGRPAKGITGAQAAAPLMFDILAAVTTEDRPIAVPPPSDFSRVTVCAHSGYRATPACPGTKTVVTVRDAAPARECPYHKQYLVESATGTRACLWKLYPDGEVALRNMTVYPPSVADVLRAADARPPPLSPSCAVQATGDTLRIVSPASGAAYVMTQGVRNTGRIPLQGYTSVRDRTISWFINNRYVGDTRSGETKLVSLSPGHSKIVAVNSAGHKDRAEVAVSAP
jgi:penicillin-binding protein 1C